MNCPNCNSPAGELLVCDRCNSVGCVRCVIKKGKEWVCEKCKSGVVVAEANPESALGYMFG